MDGMKPYGTKEGLSQEESYGTVSESSRLRCSIGSQKFHTPIACI